MKALFTDEQIIAMIKQQEAGEKTADMCRRLPAPHLLLRQCSRCASHGGLGLFC